MSEPVVVYKTRGDALLPRDASAIARRRNGDATEHARKPLGLAPVLDGLEDSDEPESVEGDLAHPEAVNRADNRPAWLSDINSLINFDRKRSNKRMFELIGEVIGETVGEMGREIEAKLGGLGGNPANLAEMRSALAEAKLENAQLKAALAEIRAKQNEHEFVLERLKIEKRGPPGVKGERGRDGAEGARGETGARGEQGPPGPHVVAFETDDASFVAVELLSNGKKGASLHLRGMFESAFEQADEAEAAEAHDAVQAQRAVIEREAENVRCGLPAR